MKMGRVLGSAPVCLMIGVVLFSSVFTSQTQVLAQEAKVKGVDVSHWQGDINWLKVYNSGYRFAFVKATEGVGLADPYFETNMNDGYKVGMLMGTCHFSRPDLGNDATEEAEYFVSIARNYLREGYLRPVLDLQRGAELGKEKLSNWIHEWMQTVKNETGIEPILYVNKTYANNYLDNSITKYNLWIAHWTYDPNIPPNTGIWSAWDFWQYSDKGSVPGIEGNVDLDIFNGDISRLYTFTIVPPALDVFLLVDLSGSFYDDLPHFKSQAPDIISTLKASNPNTRFGLGKFEDYPIYPFGSAWAGDKAYQRLVDLTFDTDLVLNTISGLYTRYGMDGPQSQLVALYQAATGAGQDLSGVGYPGASIPPSQQANFRDGATKIFLLWTDASFHHPGDPGSIPYPGPSFDETVDAILALDPPKVIGISSGGGGIDELEALAVATGAIAPEGGVDTDGDGIIDIAEGEPLVGNIGYSGAGIGEAVKALVEAGKEPVTPELVTDLVMPVAQNVVWDPATKIFAFDVALSNISTESLTPPVTAVITNLFSNPPTVTLNNPDGGGNGVGGYWDYSSTLGGGVLSPGETSEAKRWEFYNPDMVGFYLSCDIYAVRSSSLPKIAPGAGKESFVITVDIEHQRVTIKRGEQTPGNLSVPANFALEQNYPNPFNPVTTIKYGLPKDSYVKVAVYNVTGQRVTTLVNEEQQAGYHQVSWDGKGMASGIYFYRIEAGQFTQTRKMILLK